MRAKPTVSLSVRVDPPSDELRRRLQELTRLPTSRLVEEALRSLEADLERRGVVEPTA